MNDEAPLPSRSPWYRRAFEAGYLDLYAHRDEADAARAMALLQARLGLRRGQRILDLCCGAGRHLKPLIAEIGRVGAVGLDLSGALLSRARRVACGGGAFPLLCEGDMRRLPFLGETFDGVVNLFTSFGYFETDSENEGVLREIARVLRPGGFFVLDHIHRPGLERTIKAETERLLEHGVTVTERRWIDAKTRRVNKEVHWRAPGEGVTMDWTESVRVYGIDEMEGLLANAGMRVVARFGDYDGAPLDDASPRMILKAEKKA